MFEQIMSGPFTRSHYILSNICTIAIIGLVSASLIAYCWISCNFSISRIFLSHNSNHYFWRNCGICVIWFTSFIISTRLRSSEGFNVIINTVFLFFAFVSSAFYPADTAPEPLRTAFYLNPLTYLVDIIRAGIFGTVTEFVILEMVILAVLATTLFIIASKLLTRLDF